MCFGMTSLLYPLIYCFSTLDMKYKRFVNIHVEIYTAWVYIKEPFYYLLSTLLTFISLFLYAEYFFFL